MRFLLLVTLSLFTIQTIAQTDKEYYEKAVQSFSELDYKSALEDIERAILLKPGNLDYMELKGNSLFFLNDLQGSYDVMNFVLETDSTRYAPYECIGAIFDATGEFQVAIDYLTAGLQYVPNDSVKATLHCNRGASLSRVREFDKAYEDLMIAYNLNPKNIYVLTNLGGICDEVGRGDETLKYLNLILEIDPGFYPAYVNIGFKHQELGDYKQAIANFDKALEIQPNDAYAFSNRSYNKLKLGDTKGALKDINTSIELLPNNSYAYRNKALIYLEKNKFDKVCENLQLAIDNGFTSRYGPEVEELQKTHCE